MKREILARLEELENRLRALKKDLCSLGVERVSRKSLRAEAEALADLWVEDIRSPLEHRLGIQKETIREYSELFKRLHILARPNNLRKSYLAVLKGLLTKFKDRLMLPVQQFSDKVETVSDVGKLIASIADPSASEYLMEALKCANHGYRRAACVMGWCAAVDRMRRKIQQVGFQTFNQATLTMRNSTAGRFRRFNKSYNISSLSELQEVFDTDLLLILECMGIIDGAEGDRLKQCYGYRIASAHPGSAPIEEPHLVVFFSDVVHIVLNNQKFQV